MVTADIMNFMQMSCVKILQFFLLLILERANVWVNILIFKKTVIPNFIYITFVF